MGMFLKYLKQAISILFKIIEWISCIIVGLILTIIVILMIYGWYLDKKTMAKVLPMKSYLESYYSAHLSYPSEVDFKKKFPIVSEKNSSYLYWVDPSGKSFDLKYPMNAIRSYAIGRSVGPSEFTGTTYAYHFGPESLNGPSVGDKN